jgi:hypothetical protein
MVAKSQATPLPSSTTVNPSQIVGIYLLDPAATQQ